MDVESSTDTEPGGPILGPPSSSSSPSIWSHPFPQLSIPPVGFMAICSLLVFQCRTALCDIASLPWKCLCARSLAVSLPPLCALVKLAMVTDMCIHAAVQEDKNHIFLRVPDCPGLFSKVLCRIFRTKIGVNCVHFGKEWVGHCRAKIGIVCGMKFLFADVVLGWADLMNWISFQMGVFFLIANFLQFISRNSSHFAGSLWPWVGRLMYSPFDKRLFIFIFFLDFLLDTSRFPPGDLFCHYFLVSSPTNHFLWVTWVFSPVRESNYF